MQQELKFRSDFLWSFSTFHWWVGTGPPLFLYFYFIFSVSLLEEESEDSLANQKFPAFGKIKDQHSRDARDKLHPGKMIFLIRLSPFPAGEVSKKGFWDDASLV